MCKLDNWSSVICGQLTSSKRAAAAASSLSLNGSNVYCQHLNVIEKMRLFLYTPEAGSKL
jgi:hypothetical protein